MSDNLNITIAMFGAINQDELYITPNQGKKIVDTYICPLCENKVSFSHNIKSNKPNAPHFKHYQRKDNTICANFNKKPTIKDLENLVTCRRYKKALLDDFIRLVKSNDRIVLESKCLNTTNCLDENGPILGSEIYNTDDLEIKLEINNLTITLFVVYRDTEPLFNICLYIGSPNFTKLNNAPVSYQSITKKFIDTGAITETFKSKPFQDTNYIALHLTTTTCECDVCITNYNNFRSVVDDKECLTIIPNPSYVRNLNNNIYTTYQSGNICCILFDLPHLDVISQNPLVLRKDLLKFFEHTTVVGRIKLDTNIDRQHFNRDGECKTYISEPIILKDHRIILVKDPLYYDTDFCKKLYNKRSSSLLTKIQNYKNPPIIITPLLPIIITPPLPIIPNNRPTPVVTTRVSTQKKCIDCPTRIFKTDAWCIRCRDCHSKYLLKPSIKMCLNCPAKIKDNYKMCYTCEVYSKVI